MLAPSQVSGNAWLLPHNNLPTNKHLNQQRISSNPLENVGTFEVLAGTGVIDHGIEIKDVHAKGYDDLDIGMGVFTTVLSVQLDFFVFFFVFLRCYFLRCNVKLLHVCRLIAKKMTSFLYHFGVDYVLK